MFCTTSVLEKCLGFTKPTWWSYSCFAGDSGPIFLRRFRLYVLSFMFRFMFANICFEKNQNIKIHVMFITKHNMKWNRDLQFLGCLGSQGSREKSSFNLCKFGMLSINMNHNIGFFQWKNAMLRFMFDYMTWIITWI